MVIKSGHLSSFTSLKHLMVPLQWKFLNYIFKQRTNDTVSM